MKAQYIISFKIKSAQFSKLEHFSHLLGVYLLHLVLSDHLQRVQLVEVLQQLLVKHFDVPSGRVKHCQWYVFFLFVLGFLWRIRPFLLLEPIRQSGKPAPCNDFHLCKLLLVLS